MKEVTVIIRSADIDALLDMQQQLADRIVFDPTFKRYPTTAPGVVMYEWHGKKYVREIGEMPGGDCEL